MSRASKDVGCRFVEERSLVGKLDYSTKLSKSGWQHRRFWVSFTQRPEVGKPWSREVFEECLEVTEGVRRLLAG